MKKITAKFINENIDELMRDNVVKFRGCEYRLGFDGTIYYRDADDITMGTINGMPYGKIIDGVAYKYEKSDYQKMF
jgi:hypothetical protein